MDNRPIFYGIQYRIWRNHFGMDFPTFLISYQELSGCWKKSASAQRSP